jgi:hypothetical protein
VIPPSFDVVVPTTGRASLGRLLAALTSSEHARAARVVVVVDGDGTPPAPPARSAGVVEVLRSPGRGPAAARNAGWRASRAQWVVYLDDDVVPPPEWTTSLARDLAGLPGDVAASQGRVRVPLPRRRPTDWERNVSRLEQARWATADMAFRRAALAAVGGFDERFRRAYREDSDLGLRLVGAGHRIVPGKRWVEHPVGPAPFWASVRVQAGNADDALMTALHGRRWRIAAGAPPGRRRRHLAVTAAGAAALGARLAGARGLAAACLAAWGAATAELAATRIAPGPRDASEVVRMIATSALVPAAATLWWLAGWARVPLLMRRPGPAAAEPGR